MSAATIADKAKVCFMIFLFLVTKSGLAPNAKPVPKDIEALITAYETRLIAKLFAQLSTGE